VIPRWGLLRQIVRDIPLVMPKGGEGATKNATTDSFLSTPPVFPINAIVGF